MKGLFITGTGTGVGKTHVTGLLLGALRRAGAGAISIKPVQTGCAPGAIAPDLEEHWRLAGWRPADAEAHKFAPHVFLDPVSPHLAARRVGCHLGAAAVALDIRAVMAEHALALVEGAGGVLVPLNDHETMLDLMQALALPVLVVAEAGVGTINHTLLTLQALRTAELSIFGVALNARAPVAREITEDNARTIAAMGAVEVFGTLGHESPGDPLIAALATRLLEM
jgi:dethiobiotin synthase